MRYNFFDINDKIKNETKDLKINLNATIAYIIDNVVNDIKNKTINNINNINDVIAFKINIDIILIINIKKNVSIIMITNKNNIDIINEINFSSSSLFSLYSSSFFFNY